VLSINTNKDRGERVNPKKKKKKKQGYYKDKGLWKTVWRLLKKLKIVLLYDPVIPLLGIYPKNTITLI